MLVSSFHPAFIGVVVEEKEANSRMVKVKVLEQAPNLTGNLDNLTEKLTVPVSTPDGVINFSITVTDFIRAHWLNDNGYQMTAPDVQPGERVMIYQEGDSQRYYWKVLDVDQHLRQLEHVIIAISNTNPDDRRDKRLNLDNCYIVEMSTRDKRFRVRTNKNDGEPFAYEVKIDTAVGRLIATDDASGSSNGEYLGNHALLDSAKTLIELKNIDNTYYRLDKKNLIEHCVGNRTLTVGGNNTESVGGKETKTVTGLATHNFKAGRKTDSGPSDTLTAGDVKVNSPMSTFSGVVKMASFITGGAARGGYAGEITGNVKINGTVLSSGDITAPAFHGDTLCVCPVCKK